MCLEKCLDLIMYVMISNIIKLLINTVISTSMIVFDNLEMLKCARRESNPVPYRTLIYQHFYAVYTGYIQMCLGMCLDFLKIYVLCEQLSRIITTGFCYVGINIHSGLNIRMTQSLHHVLHRYTSFKQ